ncbi:MAG TPA: ATP-dependent DNA helicase, partial [Thermoanaerobaculia bacterium]|nr:ATP-dependent DNA helicase [Thermoanaerobaculia bacterium]
DIFQLGNASWQIVQVTSGTVRVADAKGAPPTIPFWLGEAPARSDELSRAVSDLRADLSRHPERSEGSQDAHLEILRCAQDDEWLATECGIPLSAAQQISAHLHDAKRVLGVLPTQDTLVLERFFDESGGMQLVLHAPFGSRINKAWGLALRKRFCRQFNFELQAAATEDAVLLSLGPQHSFPLADVFRYLHPATARDILVQAFLDAPVFQTRWRWNTTISLAVPRNRNGKKVPPQLQRSMADDMMAAVFPDAAACLENVAGDRKLPDHPLVNQAVRDCLEEAMDFDGLARVLTRIHAGEIECVARDTPEPSALAFEIINAKPYAFLDDAPLEERRTQAVYTRRGGDNQLGVLDEAAIERVRDEERPDPRDADELHDALLTAGFLTDDDAVEIAPALFDALASARRATHVRDLWIAAERLPELAAIHPALHFDIAAPASRASRLWSREDAIVELLRGRLSITGPVTASELASSLDIDERDADAALLKLESEGVVLRGYFSAASQWCDRRLLARIHRYTLNRLRAEIEPVTASDFMRFLFAWQHVAPSSRLTGIDGLRAAIAVLDGYEVAAGAWERAILPLRVEKYEPSMLDMLCLTGEVGWARLSPPSAAALPVSATPMALFLREHAAAWQALRGIDTEQLALSDPALRVLELLRARGASFARDLDLDVESLRQGLGELVSHGLVASDGFAGLRMLIDRKTRSDTAGRWSLLQWDSSDREFAIELQARSLLKRYGVVFRRLLTRETNAAPWRELARVYRRLEARGEIRGGRFVSGMSGEQFALPDAVERLREIRRTPADNSLIVLSTADPLNLTGILTTGERVRAVAGNRIAWRDGVAISVMEGDYVRPLAELAADDAMHVAAALAGRRVAAASGFVGRA